MKILVVEDDYSIAQTLAFLLSSYSYAVDIAADGEAGLQMIEAFEYDLILLDVMLPKMDGVSLCQTLRAQGLQMPVLLLTGQGGGQQKAIALNAGADDYVVKPFDADELIARVQALLRRSGPTNQPILTWGNLSIDPSRRSVTYGTHLLSLTPKEYAILELLLRNPQKTLSAKTLLEHAWSSLESPGEEAVRVHIKELRQKLTAVGAAKDWVKTVYRVGYRLNPVYSDMPVTNANQQPTPQHVAELTSINQQLRAVLEELQNAKLETERQQTKAALAEERSADLTQLNAELQQTLEELRVVEEDLGQQNQERENEQLKYQELFNFIPDGYLVTDAEGMIQEVNQAIATQLGVNQADLVGKPLLLYVAQRDHALMRRLLQQRQTQIAEITLEPATGSPLPAEVRVAPANTPIHAVTGMRWLIHDISDRNRLNVSLQNSETKLSQVLNSVSAAIVNVRIFDNRDWAYDYFSAGCETLFGYTVQDLMADKTLWLSRVLPADRETVLMPLVDVLFAEGTTTVEYRFYHQQGAIRWISSTCTSHQIEPGCWMITAINHDITDRKQLEAERQQAADAIQTSEEQLRLTLELTHIGTWNWQLETGTLIWNENHYRLFGYEPGEIEPTHQQWCDRIHPEDRALAEQRLARALENQTEFKAEYRLILKDGSIRWVLSRGRAIYNGQRQAVRMVGVVFDITSRKQAEFALQQQILQAYLVAEISQDIRRSLDLNDVVLQTVERVRELLTADRVMIVRFSPDWHGEVLMESVGEGWPSMLSAQNIDLCVSDRYVEAFSQGQIATLYTIDQDGLDPCCIELLQQFKVKANLVVPILQTEQLWGLLMVHQCSASRHWQPLEINVIRQLATQVGIAIQQSELYQQARHQLLERERMQTVLEESEERFRILSAAAPVGICQSDANGHCLYTNARWQEMSGLSFEDSLGDGWLRAIHPDDLETFNAMWNAHIKGKRNNLLEVRLLTPAGQIRWVSTRVAAINSAMGTIIGYVKTYEDITERKQTEQKIREQATLLDVASDAIFVHDLNHCILYWNQGAERLYGWQAADAIGQCSKELLHEDAEQASVILQTLLAKDQWQGEARKRTKMGQEVVVAGRLTLARDETGQPKFILAVNTNITQKKQLEAQFYRAQRLESLGTLASGIAHDLNNVFTPVLTISQLLSRNSSALDRRSQELLVVLEDSAKRGATMVKQILTFARGTGGDRLPLQIGPVLQDVVNVTRQTFPKSIWIQYEKSDQPLGLISADPTHLHQVLLNFCVNARDAMPDGGMLTFAAQNCTVDEHLARCNLDAKVGHYLLITIADTGIGIPTDITDRIFEPFFTTKQQGQGTGLGLSTALGIIKSYGGFLHIASQVGQGTQVHVYLPITPELLPPITVNNTVLDGNGELVLIVDDDPAVQQTTQTLLNSHHYKTLIAKDGKEAIALYTKHRAKINAVLMDIMMPNMNGITAVQQLRTVNPQVNIIALSGLVSHREPVLAAGAKLFLAKPYRVEDLLQGLHDLITHG